MERKTVVWGREFSKKCTKRKYFINTPLMYWGFYHQINSLGSESLSDIPARINRYHQHVYGSVTNMDLTNPTN